MSDFGWLPRLERTATWQPKQMPKGPHARLVGRPLRWRYLGDGTDRWEALNADEVNRSPDELVAAFDELVFLVDIEPLPVDVAPTLRRSNGEPLGRPKVVEAPGHGPIKAKGR